MPIIRSNNRSALSGSSAAVGSSARSKRGWWAIARMKATRWRSPIESREGILVSSGRTPRLSMALSSQADCRLSPASLRTRVMFSITGNQGNKPPCCSINPSSRARSAARTGSFSAMSGIEISRPASRYSARCAGRRIAPIISRSVLLPHPLGPVRATTSPFFNERCGRATL